MAALVVSVLVAAVAGGVAAAVCVVYMRRAPGAGTGAEHREAAIRSALEQQLGAELHRMGDLVGQLHRSQAASHGELSGRLSEALRSTRELSDTARRLQEALGNSRVRGQWGERMADDVLRVEGLVEGVNYVRQQTIAEGTRPDVTFLLPDSRQLHMDVKFPIDHYLASLQAPVDRERAEHEREFLKAVRGHLKDVAARGYADPASTPGFVLVFIPNEAVYSFLLATDPRLLDLAMGHRVVVCSPFTLLAVLAVVRQAADAFRIGQASDEILQCLARFRSEWEKFSLQLDRVAKQWETAHRGLEELAGTRRRQLERRLDHVDALRARRLEVVADVDPSGQRVGLAAESPVSEVAGGR